MTARRPSPTPSGYSTGYKPGEAHWQTRMSRSSTLSDSRCEHPSPQARAFPTLDVRQPLYAEFRSMLREHRRQEDEARDSLMRQIRDHRDQQDDMLMRIAMDLPRTFDEGHAVAYRSSISRREPTSYPSIPREMMEMDSVLGSRFNQRSQHRTLREDSQEIEDFHPLVDAKMQQPDNRPRSRTAGTTSIEPDHETPHGESRQASDLRQDSPHAKIIFVKASPSAKRKRSGISKAGADCREFVNIDLLEHHPRNGTTCLHRLRSLRSVKLQCMLKGRTLRLWHSSGKLRGSNQRPWSMDEHRRLRQHVHAIRLHVNSVGLLRNSIRILSRRSGSDGTVAFLIQCPSSLQESRFHLRPKALPIRDSYRLIPGDLNKKSRREI